MIKTKNTAQPKLRTKQKVCLLVLTFDVNTPEKKHWLWSCYVHETNNRSLWHYKAFILLFMSAVCVQDLIKPVGRRWAQ